MSTVAYIFIGNVEEFKDNEGEPEVVEGNFKIFYRVMNTDIESLFSVLKTNEECDLDDVFENEEYTSWTFSFPENFITALINIEKDNEINIIKKWMELEDCPYDNESDLSDLLKCLVEFAKKSNKLEQSLLFRMEM